jgi:hypothetical protein
LAARDFGAKVFLSLLPVQPFTKGSQVNRLWNKTCRPVGIAAADNRLAKEG